MQGRVALDSLCGLFIINRSRRDPQARISLGSRLIDFPQRMLTKLSMDVPNTQHEIYLFRLRLRDSIAQ